MPPARPQSPAPPPWLTAAAVGAAFLALLGVARNMTAPHSVRSAVTELVDGDPDYQERTELLTWLVERGIEDVVRAEDRAAAMQVSAAALLVGDRRGFERSLALWEDAPPFPLEDTDEAARRRDALSLGEAAIEQLYTSYALDARGDEEAAVAARERALRAAERAFLPLVREVAERS